MARLWMAPSLLIVLGMALGPLGAYSGAVSPLAGFYVFLAAGVLALLSALGLAGAAALASALGKPWRGAAVRAAVVPLVAMLGLLLLRATGESPPFNDVTTDLRDPPVFASGQVGATAYPEPFVAIQQQTYPDLGPLEVPDAPERAFERALAVAREMPRWEITREDPQAGIVEAVATSRLFRFRDDVVIRVRASGEGSRIDLRSRSRVGRSDLGANAARIAAFQRSFESGVAAR